MGQICLDTSSFIEYFKDNEISERIKEIIINYNSICLSLITVYEFGRGKVTEEEIDNLQDFNIIYYSFDMIRLAIKIYRYLKDSGGIIDDNDILIAASCIIKDIPLLTLNKKHFGRLKKFGLRIV